jgi:hypothetical protein
MSTNIRIIYNNLNERAVYNMYPKLKGLGLPDQLVNVRWRGVEHKYPQSSARMSEVSRGCGLRVALINTD